MADVNHPNHEWLDVEATLTLVERLHFNRAHRDASKLFYIEGVRNFVKAIDNGFDIHAIAFSEKLLTAPLARKLVRQNRRLGVPTISLTPEQFRRISYTERASGIGAIVHQRWFDLRDVSPNTGLCWVAVESVRSPGNLGSLIRTSEAVGGAGFIFIGASVDPFANDVLRASMGSLFSQKFIRTSFCALRNWVRRHSCSAIGASPDGMTEFNRFNYPDSTVIFLGEERLGLTPQQRETCQHLVRIPMLGAVDSLNLAVAGSLLMYEVYRSKAVSVSTSS